MLEIRPGCENCDKPLANDSAEAMICSFECTYCKDCVENVLKNVCPNCGGGFEKRPIRPTNCLTKFCVTNYPVGTVKKFRAVNWERFRLIQNTFAGIDPGKR